MAESTLTLTFGNLKDLLGRQIIGPKPSGGWSSSSPDDGTLLGDLVKSGLRKFYAAYKWSFLRPVTTLTTSAAYDTGTIAVASGVVTLTSGTFPSWAADGELTPSNDETYTVNTRDSDTQVTLDDTTATVSSGSSYTLTRPHYTMPDDYGAMIGPMYYRPGSADLYPPVLIVSHYDIRSRRMQTDLVDRPQLACILPLALAEGTGQRYQISFWPAPDAAYVYFYRYLVNADAPTADAKYVYGGMQHAETILSACLSEGEKYLEGKLGAEYQRYQECLAQSIETDADAHSPERLGVDYDSSDRTPYGVTENPLTADDSWRVSYDGETHLWS